MTERDLSELLERAGERVHVGPPPVPAMVAGAAHSRRRTLLLTAASAVAVVTAIGGTALLVSVDGGSPAPRPPAVASPSGVATPPGTRLVGLGHAAIAVPNEWGTNRTRCGVPQQDTVVIDVGAIETCLTSRPRGVSSVEVWPGRLDVTADQTTDVDGVPAERQHTSCAPADRRNGPLCSGTTYLPSLGVTFRAEAPTRDEVEEILSWIRVVPEQVAVPGFAAITLDHQGRAREKYVEALLEAGLAAEVRTRKVPVVTPGYILDVSPAPGTMLEPGATVTLTVVAEPEGPADEVRVEMNSMDTDGEYHDLSDEQIRSGATIELGIGDRIWAYADGRRAGTLAGELDGSSLALDGWKDGPNYPHSWVAVAPGRTNVTLTIRADGRPVTLGTVTVLVK